MIFITGGNSQGKLRFAQTAFSYGADEVTNGAVCDFAAAFDLPVLNRLHALVARMLDAGEDPDAAVAAGVLAHPQLIVICDELGCGIVPLEERDRAVRERVGRIACDLAQRADRVYRVCCGIPTCIKGEVP